MALMLGVVGVALVMSGNGVLFLVLSSSDIP